MDRLPLGPIGSGGAITRSPVERAILPCAATLLLAGGCGFQKTMPVSNVCGLLPLPEVQSLAPGLTAATEQPPADSLDLWRRQCQFTGAGVAAVINLVVSGALTPQGDQQLADDLSGAPVPEAVVVIVDGLGDRAVYTNAHHLETSGLAARQGGFEVGVGIFRGEASSGELEPLVRAVLGRLP